MNDVVEHFTSTVPNRWGEGGKEFKNIPDNYNFCFTYTVNSGAQVSVLLFGDKIFVWYGLRGVPIIMGYF